MVEQNRSGVYTQIVYAPGGQKFALMNGQTLQKAFVPLPGGGQTVYNSSGLLYYAHTDHLGSTRFASTPSRTMYFDMAYAPFGEAYAASGSTNASFTTQRQDTVAGLYDFAAREYSIQGRWSSPDPAGLRAAVRTNPQSWNRYAYVANEPMDNIDPWGLFMLSACGLAGNCGGGGGFGGDPCFFFGLFCGGGQSNPIMPIIFERPPIFRHRKPPTRAAVCAAATGLIANSLINGSGTTTTSVGGTFGVTIGDFLNGKDRNYTESLNGDSWGDVSLTFTTGSDVNGHGALGGGWATGPTAGMSSGTVNDLNGPGKALWSAIGPVAVQLTRPLGSGGSFSVGEGAGYQYAAYNQTDTTTQAQTNCLDTYANAVINLINILSNGPI
jgi:RHS repeat-associated protein